VNSLKKDAFLALKKRLIGPCFIGPILNWAQWRGTRMPLKTKTFNKRMRSRDGVKEGKSGVAIWRGIGLKRELNEPIEYYTPGVHHVEFSQGFSRAGRAA